MVLSTGNAPKNLHVPNCYMAETFDCDTFSRLSRQDDTSALVGKKAITEKMNCLVTLYLKIRRSLTVW